MTNKEILVKAEIIKASVDAIKKSTLPREVKELAIIQAKEEIKMLKKPRGI